MPKYLKTPLLAARKSLKDIDRLKEHPEILANCAYMVGTYVGAERISYNVALNHLNESVQIHCDSADLPMFKSIVIQNLKAGVRCPAGQELICRMEDEDDILADSEANT